MKNKFTFLEKKITATLVNGEFIWVAFEGTNGTSPLYKSSVYNPDLVYWDVNVVADEINFIHSDTTYLYLSLDDSASLGAKVTIANPSTITYFVKPGGITEKAIDLVDDTTFIYFLTPGLVGGANAKIVKYNKSTRAYVETINLTTVFNVKKIDLDEFGNIWIQSDLDGTPKLTKASYSGGWSFTTYTLS